MSSMPLRIPSIPGLMSAFLKGSSKIQLASGQGIR